MTAYIRPSWDEYFLKMITVIGERATCDRGRIACVIVKDNRIVSTGYVGSPPGMPHCDDVGHQMKATIHEDGTKTNHCVRTIHAEQNAICQAAKNGISINGATLYQGFTPCFTCAKMIASCGIKRIVCAKRYHAEADSIAVLEAAKIELVIKEQEVQKYANQ